MYESPVDMIVILARFGSTPFMTRTSDTTPT